jgi:hypothetical protein
MNSTTTAPFAYITRAEGHRSTTRVPVELVRETKTTVVVRTGPDAHSFEYTFKLDKHAWTSDRYTVEETRAKQIADGKDAHRYITSLEQVKADRYTNNWKLRLDVEKVEAEFAAETAANALDKRGSDAARALHDLLPDRFRRFTNEAEVAALEAALAILTAVEPA